MIEIKFYPDSDKPEFIEAAETYQQIWDSDSKRIIDTIEKVSGLRFQETLINAVVFEGTSHSHPLCLRASYPDKIKKGTLIHELCHRIIHPMISERTPELHKIIFLILYDIWLGLYGKEFADKNVEVESKRGEIYKEAWRWILSFDKETRKKKFSDFKLNGI